MMGAKAKIEGLTHSWYGFAVFSAICSLLLNGIGIFRIFWTGFWLLVSWTITFLLGRALVNKSSLVRFILLCVSGLFTLLGALGCASKTWAFVHSWELTALLTAAYTAVAAWMLGGSEAQIVDALSQAWVDGQSLRAYRHAPNAGPRKSWAAGDATSSTGSSRL